MFRLLGLHPGVSVHVDAAAALTGTGRRRGPAAARRAGPGQPDPRRPAAAGTACTTCCARTPPSSPTAHDAAPDRQAALTRLFDHYLAGSVAAMNALYPAAAPAVGDPDAARRWIEAERPNLAAACTYGAAHGWHRHAIALAETLFRYLDAGGPVAEAVTVTAAAVAAARAVGDRDAQARALTNLGRLHRRQGQLRPGGRDLPAGPDPVRRPRRSRRRGRWRCATWAVSTGDRALPAGRRPLPAGLDAVPSSWATRPGRPTRWSGSAWSTSGSATGRRRPNASQPALKLFARLGDRFSEAYVLSLLARLRAPNRTSSNRPPSSSNRASPRSGRPGTAPREAYALTDLAAVDARRGRLAEAAGHLRQALVLHRRIGDRASEAEALNDLGQVLRAAGDAAEARAQHGEALVLAREIGDRYEQARAHDGIAAAYRPPATRRARPHREQARRLFADLAVPAAPAVRRRWPPPGR